MVDGELHGIGFAVVLCHFAGLASEKFHYCVVAEVLFARLLQIQYARKRDDALERGFVGYETERELSASGVTHHQDLCGVEVVALGNLWQVTIGIANVFKSAGPASAGVADAAVLDVPGGDAFGGQRGAQVSGVGEVILGTPEASVNIHNHRKRAFRLRQAQVRELTGIGAVRETRVRGRRWEGENVVGGHKVMSQLRIARSELSVDLNLTFPGTLEPTQRWSLRPNRTSRERDRKRNNAIRAQRQC